MVKRRALLALLACSACGSPFSPSPVEPKEAWVLSETARVAKVLKLNIPAELTDTPIMLHLEGYDGPAAGWYQNGKIKFWRKVILEQSFVYGTSIAIHEVCHSQSLQHNKVFAACENLLRHAS